MDYKFLFLVGSSLEHFAEDELSNYNTEQRFQQTLETIDSIRTKVPNAYICLFECSYKSISKKHKDTLQDKVDLFLEFYDDSGIKILYENISQNTNLFTYGKSLLETRGLICSLYHIKENILFTDAQRIFKLTGRYTLNEQFDIQDYESKFLENYYVAKVYEYENKEDMNNTYAYLYQAEGMIVTGLWSFDRMLYIETIQALERSFAYLEKMIQYTTGNDIEHGLYRFLNKKKIISVSSLGLNLNKGMDGDKYSL